MRHLTLLIPICFLALTGCATSGVGPGLVETQRGETGTASYYDHGFDGRRTASGKVFDQRQLTAAHRTLPFGTRVRVTNLENGRSVVLTITDRGPFARGRIIDVSGRAARHLGFLNRGTARVRVQVVAT